MDRQDRIHAFSLAAHRLAIDRLRENPARMAEAADVIERTLLLRRARQAA